MWRPSIHGSIETVNSTVTSESFQIFLHRKRVNSEGVKAVFEKTCATSQESKVMFSDFQKKRLKTLKNVTTYSCSL